jgi:arginine decarboxylase
MKHNLFTHPTEVVVNFDKNGNYSLENIIESQNIMDVLDDMDYDKSVIDKKLKSQIEESTTMNHTQKQKLLGKLYLYLSENSYLKTIETGGEN